LVKRRFALFASSFSFYIGFGLPEFSSEKLDIVLAIFLELSFCFNWALDFDFDRLLLWDLSFLEMLFWFNRKPLMFSFWLGFIIGKNLPVEIFLITFFGSSLLTRSVYRLGRSYLDIFVKLGVFLLKDLRNDLDLLDLVGWSKFFDLLLLYLSLLGSLVIWFTVIWLGRKRLRRY